VCVCARPGARRSRSTGARTQHSTHSCQRYGSSKAAAPRANHLQQAARKHHAASNHHKHLSCARQRHCRRCRLCRLCCCQTAAAAAAAHARAAAGSAPHPAAAPSLPAP
jgi:hypothetical protein